MEKGGESETGAFRNLRIATTTGENRVERKPEARKESAKLSRRARRARRESGARSKKKGSHSKKEGRREEEGKSIKRKEKERAELSLPL